ncbi:MAG TPA: thioredoxin domain-containing protein, partial [Isosphaeraceae bacterium]
FEATGGGRWLRAAEELAGVLLAEFLDAEAGGFFYTGRSHEELIVRQKDAYDNATPSGNAMAATALARLGALTGREDLSATAHETLQSVRLVLEKAPTAAGQSLVALDFLLGRVREFAVIAGDDPAEFRAVLEAIYSPFLPHKVVAPGRPAEAPGLVGLLPLLADRPARDGRATTYICEHFACQAPVVGVAGVEAALADPAGSL